MDPSEKTRVLDIAGKSERKSGPAIPDGVSKPRFVFALAAAVVADLFSLPESVAPFLVVVLDLVWLLVLWVILGPKWELFVALLPEAIPGLSLFPTWTAVVLWIGVKGRILRQEKR